MSRTIIRPDVTAKLPASALTPPVVVIPALQPTPALVALVRDLRADAIDVLVIDDASGPDWSVAFDRCELLGAEVLRRPVNGGKGSALREAIAHVRRVHPGAGVVTADADGQHMPADIRRVRDELDLRMRAAELAGAGGTAARDAEASLVLGVRSFGGEVPVRSRVGNIMSSLALRVTAGLSLGDTQTGLRGIPASLLAWATEIPGDRYEYEYAMLVRAGRELRAVTTVPIDTVYEDGNAVSHFRPVRDSLRVLGPVLAFGVSSLLSAVADTGLFWLLGTAGAPVWAALAVARLVSGTLNFSANRWLVLQGGADVPLGRAIAAYVALAGALLLGGMLVVDALVALGTGLLGAKIIGDCLLFVISLAVQHAIARRAGAARAARS